MVTVPSPLILGWGEWVALPDLGLPAVKAKIDTGARTSALHASEIELFGSASAPMVRFVVHPHPSRPALAVACSAPVIGRRDVTSSNGDSESRFVISTTIRIGARSWPIEVTLTNRETMSYRMLLGRQAIGSDMIVEPGASFRQPKLSYRVYRNLPRREVPLRPLRIAVVTRRPEAASSRRLADVAAARGHALELIDPASVTLTFQNAIPGQNAMPGQKPMPGVFRAAKSLGPYDAVIPRISGANAHGPALVRQLELIGAFALNSGEALDSMRSEVSVLQTLLRAGVLSGSASAVFGSERAPSGAPPPGRVLRLLMVDHKVIAVAEVKRGRLIAVEGRPPVDVRSVARRATRVMRLGLATVDIAVDGGEPGVIGIATAPLLTPLERVAGIDVVSPIIAAIEARTR